MKLPAQTIRARDIDIEYHISDFTTPWSGVEPQTILMHHGFCRNMEFWRQWVPQLATQFRVVRFNSRGCGATSPGLPEDPYGSSVLAADAIALLDALEIDEVHWIGESSGGLFGLTAALAYPSRIRTLTLVNTPLKVSEAATRSYSVGHDDHAAAIRKLGMREFARQTLENRLDTVAAPREVQDWYIDEMAKVPEHVAIGHLDLTFEADLLERIRDLKLPILNLAGDRSKVAERSQMEYMQRVLPSMRLVLFPGVGHGVNVLRPEQCVAEVERFLKEQRR